MFILRDVWASIIALGSYLVGWPQWLFMVLIITFMVLVAVGATEPLPEGWRQYWN